jgi:hypothetical protein
MNVSVCVPQEYGKTNEISRDQFLVFLKTHNIFPKMIYKDRICISQEDYGYFCLKGLSKLYESLYLEDLEYLLLNSIKEEMKKEIDKYIIATLRGEFGK